MIPAPLKLDIFRIRCRWRTWSGALLALLLIKTGIYLGGRTGAFGDIDNGFTFLALSSNYSCYLIAFLFCLGSAASLSGDRSSGILRMVLPRPHSRSNFFCCRITTLLTLLLVMLLFDGITGALFGGLGFGFHDVADPALQGPQFAAGAMARTAVNAFLLTFLGLAALVAVGLFISVLVPSPVASIGTAAGLFFTMEGIRLIFREPLSSFMITSYGSIHLDRLFSLAAGMARYQEPDFLLKAWLVPLSFLVLSGLAGLLIFRRVDIVE